MSKFLAIATLPGSKLDMMGVVLPTNNANEASQVAAEQFARQGREPVNMSAVLVGEFPQDMMVINAMS
jgi:hypothetical protein